MGGFSDGLSVSDAFLTIRSRLLFDFSGGVMMLSVRRVYHRAIRTIEFMSIMRCYLFRNLHADDASCIAKIASCRFAQLEKDLSNLRSPVAILVIEVILKVSHVAASTSSDTR